MVESVLDRGLYDLEIGRHVEVARREQAVMPYSQYLSHRLKTVFAFFLAEVLNIGEDRVGDRLKGLCDPGRTYRTGWVAAAKRQQGATPACGNRWCWYQVSCEINEILPERA